MLTSPNFLPAACEEIVKMKKVLDFRDSILYYNNCQKERTEKGTDMTKLESPETALTSIVNKLDHVIKTVDEFGYTINYTEFKSRDFNNWRDSYSHRVGYWRIENEYACFDTLRSYGVFKVVKEETKTIIIEADYCHECSYLLNNDKVLTHTQFRNLVCALGGDEVEKIFEPKMLDKKPVETKVFTYEFNHYRIAELQELRNTLIEFIGE